MPKYDELEDRIEKLEQLAEKLKLREFEGIKWLKDFLKPREDNLQVDPDGRLVDEREVERLKVDSLRHQISERLGKIQLTLDELKELKDTFDEVFSMIMDHVSKRLEHHVQMVTCKTNQNVSQTPHSRDFELKCKLGSGGFGTVYMVRHTLAQQDYALKEIEIVKKDGQLEKKILREVELLSCLNHDNIVRYFTSWIESNSITANYSNDDDSEDLDDDDDEDDDQSSDGEQKHFQEKSMTDHCIKFLIKADHTLPNEDENVKEVDEIPEVPEPKSETYFMCIQMELCTNNTLKDAIASKSWFNNHKRSDRLFREIIEGLAHIHEHKIIHRDLKPGNIFLNSKDRIKIGDFGLATRVDLNCLDDNKVDYGNLSQPMGTLMYMAPELEPAKSYNQKVDIYSLGIIFFEMYYPHPKTQSERMKILYDLREPNIKLPNDVDHFLVPLGIDLVQSLLNHDHAKRPTSSQLLQNSFFKTRRVKKVKKTGNGNLFNLRNIHLPKYKPEIQHHVKSTLVDIFKRHGLEHYPLPNTPGSYSSPSTPVPFYKTPEGMRILDGIKEKNLCLRQYDHRITFARHVALKGYSMLRCYSFQEVLRFRKISYHPQKNDACNLDIISSESENLSKLDPVMQVIILLNNVLKRFDCRNEKVFILHLNHAKLLQGLLFYHQIPEEKHSLAMEIVAESSDVMYKLKNANKNPHSLSAKVMPYLMERFDKAKINFKNHLDEFVNILVEDFESIEQLKCSLKRMLNGSQLKPHHLKGVDMINMAVNELEEMVKLLEIARFSRKPKFSPSLVTSYYSGTIFELKEEIANRVQEFETIAIGGCYNDLIKKFKTGKEATNRMRNDVLAAGLSISIKSLAKMVAHSDEIKPKSDRKVTFNMKRY